MNSATDTDALLDAYIKAKRRLWETEVAYQKSRRRPARNAIPGEEAQLMGSATDAIEAMLTAEDNAIEARLAYLQARWAQGDDGRLDLRTREAGERWDWDPQNRL